MTFFFHLDLFFEEISWKFSIWMRSGNMKLSGVTKYAGHAGWTCLLGKTLSTPSRSPSCRSLLVRRRHFCRKLCDF